MNANRERSNQTLDQRIGTLASTTILALMFMIGFNVKALANQATYVMGNDSWIQEAAEKECKDSVSPKDKLRCKKNEISLLKTGQDLCGTKKTEAGKALGKARSACKQAGVSIKKCIERASECAEYVEEEQPLGDMLTTAATQFFPQYASAVSGLSSLSATPRELYRGQCMNSQDFKSEKRELQDSMKDLGRDVKDLQKEIAETKEESEEDKKDISDQLTDIFREQTKRTKELKDGMRRADQELITAQVETRIKIGELRSGIITKQAEISRLLIERASALQELSGALISNRCQVELNKYIQENYKSVGLIGGPFLVNYAQRKKQDIKTRWQLCLEKAQQVREAQRVKYSAEIEKAELDLKNAKEQIAALESGLQTAASDAVAGKTEAEQAELSQKEADRQQAVALNNQALAVENKAKALIASREEALAKAKSDIAKASADLVSLGAKPAGKKAPEEAIDAYEEYLALRKSAEEYCGDLDKKEFPVFETKGTDD